MKLTTFVAAHQHVLFTCFRSFQVFRQSIRVLLDRPDDVSTRFAMETRKVNKFGRSHHPGVTLDQDFRCSVIDRIISDRGDRITGCILCVPFALCPYVQVPRSGIFVPASSKNFSFLGS